MKYKRITEERINGQWERGALLPCWDGQRNVGYPWHEEGSDGACTRCGAQWEGNRWLSSKGTLAGYWRQPDGTLERNYQITIND